MRYMGDSLRNANLFDGRGKFLKEGGPRVNTEGDALFIEIKSHKVNPQIILIGGEDSEETKGVFDVDFREETLRADGGDGLKDGVELEVLTGSIEEAGVNAPFPSTGK
jgi:hypothetical protein